MKTLNFFQAMKRKPVTSKISVEILTQPGKSYHPRKLIDRINKGQTQTQEIFVGLPNDNDRDSDDFLFPTDDVDLATAKELLETNKKKAKKMAKEQQEQIAKQREEALKDVKNPSEQTS